MVGAAIVGESHAWVQSETEGGAAMRHLLATAVLVGGALAIVYLLVLVLQAHAALP